MALGSHNQHGGGVVEHLGEPTLMPSEPSADFDLGETRRVMLFSVVEGDGKC
jgi:hypothetical protein